MRIRVGWLLATAVAYGLIGGTLLFCSLWEPGQGLTWTQTTTQRLGWALLVFLSSTMWLARRSPALPPRRVALHAAASFVLGAAVTWLALEYQMTGSQHPWDTEVARLGYHCLGCPLRMPILRQTLVATLLGTIAAAGLAPLIARAVRRVRLVRSAEPA